MSKSYLGVTLTAILSSSNFADNSLSFTLADQQQYEATHQVLVEAFHQELQKSSDVDVLLSDIKRHQKEIPLKEVCASCFPMTKKLRVDEVTYEPSVWLYEPSKMTSSTLDKNTVLIAYPPSGDDQNWTVVSALTTDGRWITLDARSEPKVAVLVVRINGNLSFQKQLLRLNNLL